MSTQSGISATQNLIDEFKSFLESDETILIAHIANETVDLGDIISKSSVSDAFEELKTRLNDSEAKYIIVKNTSLKNSFTFVSFVPDYAAVKDKMLYASSKNTLIRQLGSEFFNHILFWNDLSEIDYSNWSKIVSVEANKQTLSSEEKELEHIKQLEFDTLVQSTSSKQKLVSHSNALSFKFHENTELEDLTPNELYSYNIDLDTEEIFISNTTSINSAKEIVESISSDYPQFNLIKYNGSVFFIYSCPSGSKVKERMVYASNKQGLINHLKKTFTIDKSFEVGDAVELELSEFDKDLSALSSNLDNKLKFSKPSRPGRRR